MTTGPNSGNRWFKFTYDGLNRLTKSEYSNANQLSEEIAYDKAGNITILKRDYILIRIHIIAILTEG